MKRIDLSILIGIIVAIFMGSFTGFGAQCEEVRDEMVRLHILANSDSIEDQNIKYAVRDALLAKSPAFLKGASSKLAVEAEISRELLEIEAIAQNTIESMGYDYPVKANLVNMYFETRQYDGFTVPAGKYDAIRVIIGSGEGKNWWCVMFPPMCVPAASEKNLLPIEKQIESLGTQPHYKPKFAVVELIENVKNKLSGDTEIIITESDDGDTLPYDDAMIQSPGKQISKAQVIVE